MNYLGGATADNGCGVTFMGEFWYFGDDQKVSRSQLPEYHLCHFRPVKSLAATLSDKEIWDSNLTMALAKLSLNQPQEYCFVLTKIILSHAICKISWIAFEYIALAFFRVLHSVLMARCIVKLI